MNQKEILSRFSIFNTGKGGIESFIVKDAPVKVLDRIKSLSKEPLSKVQLDQLLGLCEERAVSDGFFEYYWTSEPKTPYKLSVIPGYSSGYKELDSIQNIDHLIYGLHRIFIDGLLYRGNVRVFYRESSVLTFDEINKKVKSQLIDTEAVKRRGPILPLEKISKDSRYLISEMACKSYGDKAESNSEMKRGLIAAWKEHAKNGGGKVFVSDLLDKHLSKTKHSDQQKIFKFSADDILEEEVSSEADVEEKYGKIAVTFNKARKAALANTNLYLSLVNDLDVYVATSMRNRQDFRDMASRCETIFSDEKVKDLHLRFFDPTMSAAEGHQDKGLIECLMVKCAKVLVYCAGEKESYGKDAEAAMALSLGKPVVFLCDEHQRENFYRDVHPLSRLINFENGVAVGAMVTCETDQVSELLDRLFENEMEYELVQPKDKPGYLQLVETLTKSVVRIQTNDKMLSESFWNYYTGRQTFDN